MRRQAKPFTVEVRKSRKAGSGPEPLFSAELLAQESEPVSRRTNLPGPALFSSPAPGKPRILEANGEAEKPSTRILPDLSAAPVTAAPEPIANEDATVQAPRPRKARKPRTAIAAFAVEDSEADDAGNAEIVLPFTLTPTSKRVMPSRAERRAKRAADGMPVPRWERWKRRLPPVLR